MKVLISGGCGFIGSHLTERFVSEGFGVRTLGLRCNLTNIRHLLGAGRVEFLRGDIRDISSCLRAVRGCDLVCHLAALVSVDESINDPRPFWEVNVGGTFNLLEASRTAKVRRFQYMSTCEVLGHIQAPLKANEEWSPMQPRSPYAASKLAAEAYCRVYQATYDFPVVIIRAFNTYGPRQSSGAKGGVIAKFVDFALRGLPLEIYGDGTQSRDWTFVTDVVEAIYKAVTVDGTEGQTFHIASGVPNAIVDVASKIVALVGDTSRSPIIARNARPGELRRSCGDAKKAREVLGWEPKVDFEEGVKRTAEYLRKLGS